MIIYKTTNLINGSIYIGKACDRNILRNYFGSGTYLKRAIKKYGKDNFYRTIIDEAETREDQNLKEKFWISFYRKIGHNMYNIAPGGEGGCGKHSEQTRRKIGNAHRGVLESEETKRILSLSHIGIKQSVDTIQKRIEKTKGMKRTEETRLKISISQKGNSNAKGKPSKHRGRTWIIENGKRLWKESELR
jgi:group I intron endonuclease